MVHPLTVITDEPALVLSASLVAIPAEFSVVVVKVQFVTSIAPEPMASTAAVQTLAVPVVFTMVVFVMEPDAALVI